MIFRSMRPRVINTHQKIHFYQICMKPRVSNCMKNVDSFFDVSSFYLFSLYRHQQTHLTFRYSCDAMFEKIFQWFDHTFSTERKQSFSPVTNSLTKINHAIKSRNYPLSSQCLVYSIEETAEFIHTYT